MKAPKTTSSKKTPVKPDSTKEISGINFTQVVDLTNTSVDAFKASISLLAEKEVTKRTLIESQKEIQQGEQNLIKATLQYDIHIQELNNQDKLSVRQHYETMEKILHEGTTIEQEGDYQNRVLKMLEAKEITAEEATRLLSRNQE